MRTGPPKDDTDDLGWPAWAGVVPLSVQPGEPVPDEHVPAGAAPFAIRRSRYHASP